jgi:hypothetical protein
VITPLLNERYGTIDLNREAIDSRELAEFVARRARAQAAAYQQFLEDGACPPKRSFEDLPLTDKATYLKSFCPGRIEGDDFVGTFSVFSWSGSSGYAFLLATDQGLAPHGGRSAQPIPGKCVWCEPTQNTRHPFC